MGSTGRPAELREKLQELQALLPRCLLSDHLRLGVRVSRALERLRLGRPASLPLERWLAQARASIALRELRARLAERVRYPAELPIVAHKDAIVRAIRENRAVVIAGDTGSGKSTQIPKMCLEAGRGRRGRIGCTQPRRVAARAVSRRLAEELQVSWGREVGCKIRFADHSRPETTIKVMTDGILLAEIQGDPLLAEYDTVIVDEAHERSINIDFLLGHLRNLLRRRDDLKVIVTSATIDTELFAEAFEAPVIQVSGRLYPIEIRYAPIEEERQEQGETTYVEAAAEAVEAWLNESAGGDVLVFMPAERDIRETMSLLERRLGGRIEIIPLFARLTAAEQERIFHPGPARRVIVATNIAETSITVPRIRCVVDAGLARISRYTPGSRSLRLPIEPISRSSADQRAGRCGRLEGGVCIRLYAEEDYLARPRFTEPEIRRCNLADVLLRLKAHGLGEIETFPFVEPPRPEAIRAAYQLLEELGAIDEEKRLTPLGRELAYLPVDPAVGRMILEARRQGALRETLIIAAGLSIQDPREHPFERRQEARQAHAQFEHPRSDFLTLLNIWEAYHGTWESLQTQSQLRKFCRSRFLSYPRMREWVDLHAQLLETLRAIGGFRLNERPASEEAIHRAVLSGLLSHIGRKTGPNLYQGCHSRQLVLFPGSTLFRRSPPKRKGRRSPAPAPTEDKPAQPQWIMAGEIVETSRRFARMAAGIRPEWALELARRLCRVSHADPVWDRRSGRTLVTERVFFRGLPLREQRVPYSRIDPEKAKELFLRKALIEEDIDRAYPFLEHNRQLKEKIEFWQSRLPRRLATDIEEALFRFYARRLPSLASLPELDRAIREAGGDDFLRAGVEDLLGPEAERFDPDALPETIRVGEAAIPVRYRYAPGEEADGVTFQLRAPLAELVDPQWLEWAAPALREERALELLRRLPKTVRRELMPLRDTAARIVREVSGNPKRFPENAAAYLLRVKGVRIPPEAFALDKLPEHLRPRVEVVDEEGRALAAGRDLLALREKVRREALAQQRDAWRQAAARWERYNLEAWTIGDPPERVLVARACGLPVHGFPGLHLDGDQVHLRLFARPEEAEAATRRAWPKLAERALRRDLAWTEKDLRKALRPCAPLYACLGPPEQLARDAWHCLLAHALPPPERPLPLRQAAFEACLAQARRRLRTAPADMAALVKAILELRQETLLFPKPHPGMAEEVNALVPPNFFRLLPYERLAHLPRYLKALRMRAERAATNPLKDREKAARVLPFLRALRRLSPRAKGNPALAAGLRRLRWLIEEFKVACFAQELGTAEKVSEKRLAALVAELEELARPAKKR